MHLDGHVGAGRKAGSGNFVDADVVFRQRHRRDNCGGNGGAQQDRGEQAHGDRCERYEHAGRKRAPQCWLRSHAVSDLVLLVSSQGACTQADRAAPVGSDYGRGRDCQTVWWRGSGRRGETGFNALKMLATC